MNIKPICPYSFGANTYAIFADGHAFVIDPAASVEAIMSAIADEGAVLDGILLTHGHFDHTIALDTLRKATGAPAYIHSGDAVMLTDGKKDAFFTFYGKENIHAPADHLLYDGQLLTLGNEQLRVIHTPGHSQGSVCFVCDDFIVTGDTLFAESIGRCDLWGGDEEQIHQSLNSLRSLDKGLRVYAGHGAPSRLGTALDNAAYFF